MEDFMGGWAASSLHPFIGGCVMTFSLLFQEGGALEGPEDAESILNGVEVTATITASVWDVTAKVGDEVKEGDKLVVLEAMKMVRLSAILANRQAGYTWRSKNIK